MPQYFQFTTPNEVAAEQRCGKVVFSDMHVSGGPGNGNYPTSCGGSTTLSAQEKAGVAGRSQDVDQVEVEAHDLVREWRCIAPFESACASVKSDKPAAWAAAPILSSMLSVSSIPHG